VRVRAQQAVSGAVTVGGTHRAQPARGEELGTGCERHDCDQVSTATPTTPFNAHGGDVTGTSGDTWTPRALRAHLLMRILCCYWSGIYVYNPNPIYIYIPCIVFSTGW